MSRHESTSKHDLTRRQFVRAAGASGALALTQAGHVAAADAKEDKGKGPDTKLPTRVLGKTGLKVSTICYGSYNLSNPKLLDAALDQGITLVLTCHDYQGGTAERAIGEVMKRRRKSVVLGTGKKCRKSTTTAELLGHIDESLKRLQTDCIDLWRVHYVDDPEVLKNPAIYESFDKAKKAGKVKHLGLSTHTSPIAHELIKTAVEMKRFEYLMAKYNFMEMPANYVPFQEAAKAGMGVVVFKVYAGHRSKGSREMARLKQRLNISGEQAKIKWALQNKNVCSIVSGERSFEGIQEACEAASTPLSRAEKTYLDAYARRFANEYCRFCGSCVAACPHGVKVDDVMRFAMYFKYYQHEKAAMQEYTAMPESMRAAACATCDGPCARACPNGVDVRPQLIEAHSLLSMEDTGDRYA